MAPLPVAPTSCVAGDTVSWTVAAGVVAPVPAAGGWTLAVGLAGERSATGTVVREGDGSATVTVAASATAQLPAGAYGWALTAHRTVTGPGGAVAERVTLATGALVVRPDLAAQAVAGLDARHPDEVALSLAYARRSELLADNLTQYSTNGGQRSVTRRALAELSAEIRALETRIARRRNGGRLPTVLVRG